MSKKMDVNCDLLEQYLKRYAQTVDKPTGFISEAIKDALKKAAPYKNERSQWKSGIHKIALKKDIFHDSFAALSVTEEELAQFHMNGTQRLQSGMEQSVAKQKQEKITRPHQPIQKSLHNFGFKSSESNGHKRKMDSLNDNMPQATPKLKITDHREPNTSNWNPKNNWQSPHASGESLGKFNPAAQIKSLMKPADTLQGHFGMDQPVPNRKYAPNPPPVKQQPNRSNSYENNAPNTGPFRSARDELVGFMLELSKQQKSCVCFQAAQNMKKYGHPGVAASGPVKRSLGTRKGGIYGKFVPPKKISEDGGDMMDDSPEQNELEPQDERLRNIDPKMVEMITNEIMYVGKPVEWDDIAGLEFAKTTIQEIVVWPLLRPDIFSGLRGPPKGILLFGPPGTGKTLIGKCIAAQSKSTFFSISASSLTSKWIGDGEKMVRALFAVARCHQPAVRPVTLQDFRVALQQVRPSVSNKDLQSYEQWNKTYGYAGSVYGMYSGQCIGGPRRAPEELAEVT
ncbi:hypothetical protein B566_EDAN008250 [Ephemera danica]|nr:hypothetical protein B566_EDAN008250 [Ephemera danica]